MDHRFSERIKAFFIQILRILPLACMLGGGLWFLSSGKGLSLDTLLKYSPSSPVYAAIFLLLAFAAKSLSMFFPVLLLFAVGGRLFPLPLALLINTLGIAIVLSLPYMVGRWAGADLTGRLMEKYPRLAEIRAIRSRNNFFFAFIVRAVGILPCDVVSLYLGNTRLPYPQYIAGGVLGFMPDIVCATVVGLKISDTSSPWFWLSIGLNIVICLASIIVYKRYMNKARGPEPYDKKA